MPFGWGNKDKSAAPDLGRFDAFDRALPPDPGSLGPAAGWTEDDTKALLGREFPLYTAFLAGRARSSVGDGLLRFFLPDTEPSLRGWAGAGGWHADWPSMPRGVAFASDWLGRLYLFDLAAKGKKGEPAIALLSPSMAEWIQLDYDFGELLGEAFAEGWEELLHAELAAEWRALGNPMPAFDACVAPKVSMLLGGSDEPADCELTPLVVATAFGGQVWEQVKDLPPGTTVSSVSIS